MTDTSELVKVLITVMTYPHPSEKHKEVVCTAGVTDKGEWVRLYPIDYRYRPKTQKFRKYQWIEVQLEPRGNANDNRKESRKPDLDSIKILGPRILTGNQWFERKKIIDTLPHHTVKELTALHKKDRTSLGVVRPSQILDLKISPADSDWKPQWQRRLSQLDLFDGAPKQLSKIPFKFQYVFKCEDSKNPHCIMVEDWELGILFLRERDRLKSDKRAAESVRKKFFGEMCAKDKDTRFFMGNNLRFGTWLVLGVFWPPKTNGEQLDLFS
ncbi:hypothetical protein ACFL1X_04660 [Candidatus Hydrogenedentota bacterium]